ncbi:hypothetical protein AGLY_001848 [Aphis glycines]|uniref:Uncharacterized protein n=1 Tax=Aphis glycines TaxID=307491 RepID=A0A6G0U517_APHGL|nr:hypothetical protein AGLY_001848 [Aphis glycines]
MITKILSDIHDSFEVWRGGDISITNIYRIRPTMSIIIYYGHVYYLCFIRDNKYVVFVTFGISAIPIVIVFLYAILSLSKISLRKGNFPVAYRHWIPFVVRTFQVGEKYIIIVLSLRARELCRVDEDDSQQHRQQSTAYVPLLCVNNCNILYTHARACVCATIFASLFGKFTFIGAHTQNMKRLRGSAKWDNKEHHGPNRHFLDSYLAGFLWRTGLNGQDTFETI